MLLTVGFAFPGCRRAAFRGWVVTTLRSCLGSGEPPSCGALILCPPVQRGAVHALPDTQSAADGFSSGHQLQCMPCACHVWAPNGGRPLQKAGRLLSSESGHCHCAVTLAMQHEPAGPAHSHTFCCHTACIFYQSLLCCAHCLAVVFCQHPLSAANRVAERASLVA